MSAPAIRLVRIDAEGNPIEPLELSELAAQVCDGNAAYLSTVGYRAPWVAYLAVSEDADGRDLILGTCSYKGPPREGQVELAYFTFPDHEGRGVATQMARELIALSQAADPSLRITAQTLREANASTRILTRLGFVQQGTAWDDEVGEVWVWTLRL